MLDGWCLVYYVAMNVQSVSNMEFRIMQLYVHLYYQLMPVQAECREPCCQIPGNRVDSERHSQGKDHDHDKHSVDVRIAS